MLATTVISLQNYGVGALSADPAAIRGEGGPRDPRLVVPVRIRLDPLPEEQQVALVRLAGSLHASSPAFPSNQIGPADSQDLTYHMGFRTLPSAASEGDLDLRIRLTLPQVACLEELRHGPPEPRFALYLKLEGTAAWVRTAGFPGELGAGEGASRMGIASELWPFWYTKFGELRLEIERTTWVENVLPGLGYDQLRLVEVDLGRMPTEGVSVQRFDEAIRAHDEGRYDACVASCRDIRNAWERALGATQQRPVHHVLAELLGWPEGDWHRGGVEHLWRGFAQMTNAAHHLGQHPGPPPFTPEDAKLCLMLALQLSEYIDRARRRAAGIP